MKLKVGKPTSFLDILKIVNLDNFQNISFRNSGEETYGVTVTYKKDKRSYFLRLIIDDVDSWSKSDALIYLQNLINGLH